MKTINTFMPTESVDSFVKLAKKTQKNVEGFEYTVGKPYDKVFYHSIIEDGKFVGKVKCMHNVCDVYIHFPEENNWRLLATYNKGAFMPTDFTKLLVPKIKEHGIGYNKCDVCGHYCVNSFLIENTETGDELQVGCECAKKFGINTLTYLSKFTSELHKIYDYSLPDIEGDEPEWRGSKDAPFKTAYLTEDLIAAAKAEYDECPVWRKGVYTDGRYVRSRTSENIEARLNSGNFKKEVKYVCEVGRYLSSKEPITDFEKEMRSLNCNVYACAEQAVYAFFMVKNYEERNRQCNIKVGEQVKIEGKIIQIKEEQSYYGIMTTNTILTDSGIECVRIGKIPMTVGDDGYKHTLFYAIVKDVRHGRLYLDRATKNPKKGIEVVNV